MTTPDKATITPGMTTITGAPEASLAPGRGSPLRGLAARSSWLGATLLVVVAAACGGATPTAVTGPDSGPGGGTGVTPAATSLAGDEAPSPVPAPIPALPLAPASIATPRGVPSPTAVALSTTAPAIETAGPDLTPPITVDVTPPPSPGPLEAPTPTPTALPDLAQLTPSPSAMDQSSATGTVTPTETAPLPTPTVSKPTSVAAATPTPVPATPAPSPTFTAPLIPSPTPVPPPINVQIVCVFFDGVVPTSEADEYVEIRNFGAAAADIGGWSLTDIADGTPTYLFPPFSLNPGVSIRVYTNEIHPGSGGFSFGRGSSIWNNKDPDEAGLFDASGSAISQKSYPPGCDITS